MPLRFPGHYHDRETGLHYNRFRYYTPELGRYLQSDPLGIAAAVNLYAYADNPLVEVDVRGLKSGAASCGGNGEDGKKKKKQNSDGPEDGPNTEGPPRVHIERRRKGENARDAAERKAREIRTDRPDPQNQPTVVTVVRDKKTGKTYTAESGRRTGGPPLRPEDQHHNTTMPSRSEEPWPDPGSCGEPKAIDAALKDGARKKDLEVATVSVRNGSDPPSPKPCCANCQKTTKGTRVLTDPKPGAGS
jgi:RHS repeat-associated protein